MEMKENYGNIMDLVFPSMPQPLGDHLHYTMVMLGGNSGGGIPFGSDSTMGTTSGLSGPSGDSGGGGNNGLDMEIGGRWPKEETLALLDIRVRLGSKFKEAKHKGHLWDEVSRIMCVEHGYKRSGRKCSEKFENLYKYYKKIKEGKARRQDKKHYRFFYQLEAILGETTTNVSAVSVANAASPPFPEDNYHPKLEGMLEKKHWKTKITEFIETKMNTIMEKQDKWMEKVMNTIEEKERERISKETQRRKEEAARLEREKAFRSNERARMKYREATLMEALHKLTKSESIINASSNAYSCNNQDQVVIGWGENETTQLIELRSSMETRFEKCGFMEDVLWEEIAIIMASLGYNRSALIFKAKWDHINFLSRNKKQKGCSNYYYDHHNNTFNDDQQILMTNANDHMMWNYYGKIKENI